MRNSVPVSIASLLLALGTGPALAKKPAAAAAPARASTQVPSALENSAEGKALLAAWKDGNYRWTPEVSAAYLAFSKAQALKEIAEANQTLPADFLAWIDATPDVAMTIYGQSASGAANRLRILRSLEIDLGQDIVRNKYTQFALALAVTRQRNGAAADLSDRKPLELRIPGDPRVLVDTHPKNRPLDVNDHIINFLNDHAPIPDDGHARRVIYPELAYNANGDPIPNPEAKPQIVDDSPGTPGGPKTRHLFAADVIADPKLEEEFNAYMKAHGQTVQIHCGSGARLNWNSHDAKGVDTRGVRAAYDLFLNAYKEKGYFPAAPDRAPSMAESFAYYIRNNEQKPARENIAWPRFPLNAPWPVLTYLALDEQSLRVREDMWQRYRDHGEIHGYGEYVGKIAQVVNPLEARRLTPYEFNYGSIQMELKDGGVCGTMASISVYNMRCLGQPAAPAGQPGHCAVVKYVHNAKDDTYACVGGQYATAGDSGTTPHLPWVFDDSFARRPMYYCQSVGYAVNAGEAAYLQTMAARSFFKTLPQAAQKAHGLELLESAVTQDPYNMAVVDDAQATATTAYEQIHLWKSIAGAIADASKKPGCPATSLFSNEVRGRMYGHVSAMAAPTDKAQLREALEFLVAAKCPDPKLVVNYQLAFGGTTAENQLLVKTAADFKTHLASPRSPAECAAMAARISALADKAQDKARMDAWLAEQWKLMQGHEAFQYAQPLAHHRSTPRIGFDDAVPVLAKRTKQPMPSDAQMMQPLLDQITTDLQTNIAGKRSKNGCNALAARIQLAAGSIKDVNQKSAWAAKLGEVMKGHEHQGSFADPCAGVIAGLTPQVHPSTSPGTANEAGDKAGEPGKGN